MWAAFKTKGYYMHEGKVVLLTALLVVMLHNELWNYTLFGLRSTLAALVGVAAFLAPLTILEVSLLEYDLPSALLFAPYCLSVLYDLYRAWGLWQLNPG